LRDFDFEMSGWRQGGRPGVCTLTRWFLHCSFPFFSPRKSKRESGQIVHWLFFLCVPFRPQPPTTNNTRISRPQQRLPFNQHGYAEFGTHRCTRDEGGFSGSDEQPTRNQLLRNTYAFFLYLEPNRPPTLRQQGTCALTYQPNPATKRTSSNELHGVVKTFLSVDQHIAHLP
jgi:hypothetical protein